MKTKKIFALLLTGLLTFGLMSCTNKEDNTNQNNNSTNNSINNDSSSNETTSNKIETCDDLAKLIGKTKNEVINILGKGEENISENELLGIYYSQGEVFGEKAGIDIGFDTTKKVVSSVGIFLETEGEETYKKIEEKLTSELGAVTSKEEAGEDSIPKEIWKKDGVNISLIKMGEATSISIE